LLSNLGNAVEAVCGPSSRGGALMERVLAEGQLVLRTAGINFVDREEDDERRGPLLAMGTIGGAARGGGSTWQSLVRATGSIETDYLTGEIVLQGRLHGVATPVNELLQRLANELARERKAPGAWSVEDVEAMIDAT
jgi:2-dehydropantoate 2-reductase